MTKETDNEISGGAVALKRPAVLTVNMRYLALGILGAMCGIVIAVGIWAVTQLSVRPTADSVTYEAVENVQVESAEEAKEPDMADILSDSKAWLNGEVVLTGYVSSIIDTEDEPELCLVCRRADVLGYRYSDSPDDDALSESSKTEEVKLHEKSAVAVYGLKLDGLKPGDRITVTGTLTRKAGVLEIRDAKFEE